VDWEGNNTVETGWGWKWYWRRWEGMGIGYKLFCCFIL